MRTQGTLIKWTDDRGFGIVGLPQSDKEVFVHVSAFPRDGVRPRVGETISFEIRTAQDGRKRAEAVERPGTRRASTSHAASKRGVKTAIKHPTPRGVRISSLVDLLLAGAAVVALGFFGHSLYVSYQDAGEVPSVSKTVEKAGLSFKCDGRTHCSQMTSCAEARYFLQNCPGTKMDGDRDGRPCERQWCN